MKIQYRGVVFDVDDSHQDGQRILTDLEKQLDTHIEIQAHKTLASRLGFVRDALKQYVCQQGKFPERNRVTLELFELKKGVAP